MTYFPVLYDCSDFWAVGERMVSIAYQKIHVRFVAPSRVVHITVVGAVPLGYITLSSVASLRRLLVNAYSSLTHNSPLRDTCSFPCLAAFVPSQNLINIFRRFLIFVCSPPSFHYHQTFQYQPYPALPSQPSVLPTSSHFLYPLSFNLSRLSDNMQAAPVGIICILVRGAVLEGNLCCFFSH